MERLEGTERLRGFRGWPRPQARTAACGIQPLLKMVVLAAVLGLSSLLVLAASAWAGPDPYLCNMTTARGAIPSSFATQACFNGRTLTISNNLSIPMSVQVRGDVGNPTRTETDYGIAAEATRAVSTEPRVLLPGDTLRFPTGLGAAELRLTAARYADFYVLATTIADFLPGGASADTASIQVAGGAGLASASAPYGSVASFSGPLNGQLWTLENSATSSDDQIAVNGVATCSTSTGY
jgi:hypothetical protein